MSCPDAQDWGAARGLLDTRPRALCDQSGSANPRHTVISAPHMVTLVPFLISPQSRESGIVLSWNADEIKQFVSIFYFFLLKMLIELLISPSFLCYLSQPMTASGVWIQHTRCSKTERWTFKNHVCDRCGSTDNHKCLRRGIRAKEQNKGPKANFPIRSKGTDRTKSLRNAEAFSCLRVQGKDGTITDRQTRMSEQNLTTLRNCPTLLNEHIDEIKKKVERLPCI